MLRSHLLRSLLVAPVVLGLLLLTPVLASADDDQPAPKRVRVMIKKKAAPKSAPQADPMRVLHDWFVGKLQAKTSGDKTTSDDKTMQDKFAAWFSGGSDVPMAGLRDAFKAHGWDAEKLGTWLSHHMAGQAPAAKGPGAHFGPGMLRSFTTRGPVAHGWFSAPGGAGHGRQGSAAPQHGGACPQCGHGAQAHGGFGRSPMPRGPHMGPRGMRGFVRGPFGRRGHGMRGQGMRGQGMRGQRFGMRGFPGHAPHGQSGGMMGGAPRAGTHTQSHAYLLWHDGHGWRRQELPGGVGFGAIPFQGPLHFGVPMHREGVNYHIERKPGSDGSFAFGVKPAPQHPSRSAEQMQQLMELLKSLPQGAGKPGAAGQPGQAGSVGGMDQQKLQQLMQMLEQLRQPSLGDVTIHSLPGVHVAPGMMKSLQDLLKQLEQQKKGAAAEHAPKRVRIKAGAPKEIEIIEEIEIK